MFIENYNNKKWTIVGWNYPKEGDHCLLFNNKFERIVVLNDNNDINKKCFILKKREQGDD